ncbi:MAG: S4 domain-containing protein, partial [Alphaproteobacteria bacterium]
VPTVFASRQFINHGHVTVNGKKVTIPSYQVKLGDVVEVRQKAREIPLVIEALTLPERDVPEYIDMDPKKMSASMTRVPSLDDVPYPVQMEPNLVIEFYSR